MKKRLIITAAIITAAVMIAAAAYLLPHFTYYSYLRKAKADSGYETFDYDEYCELSGNDKHSYLALLDVPDGLKKNIIWSDAQVEWLNDNYYKERGFKLEHYASIWSDKIPSGRYQIFEFDSTDSARRHFDHLPYLKDSMRVDDDTYCRRVNLYDDPSLDRYYFRLSLIRGRVVILFECEDCRLSMTDEMCDYLA